MARTKTSVKSKTSKTTNAKNIQKTLQYVKNGLKNSYTDKNIEKLIEKYGIGKEGGLLEEYIIATYRVVFVASPDDYEDDRKLTDHNADIDHNTLIEGEFDVKLPVKLDCSADSSYFEEIINNYLNEEQLHKPNLRVIRKHDILKDWINTLSENEKTLTFSNIFKELAFELEFSDEALDDLFNEDDKVLYCIPLPCKRFRIDEEDEDHTEEVYILLEDNDEDEE